MANKRYSNEELALLFQRLFATQDGKDVLQVLKTKFEDPSVVPAQVTDGTALNLLTFVRIGEANVVKYVNALINKNLGENVND